MKKLSVEIVSIIFLLACNGVNAQTFTNYSTIDGLPGNFISGGVAIDNDNNKWFGTSLGVAMFDDVNWTVYTTADSLIDNNTLCIAVDDSNDIWVGTNWGVGKFDGTNWTKYRTTDGLIDNTVKYIACDHNMRTWFATGAGVSMLEGATWTSFTSMDGLPADDIQYITTDNDGNVWFGTLMGGFSKYDGIGFENFSKANIDSLPDNNIFAIAVDDADNRWIGTWYGLTKLDASNNWVANYDSANGLFNNYVRDIKFDSYGDVWAGLYNPYNMIGGISVYNGLGFTSFSRDDSLADKMVVRLAVDQQDNVWIATGNRVSKLSGVSGIREEIDLSVVLNLYPNPATDFVKIPDLPGPSKLVLSGMSGNFITERNISSGTYTFDTRDITPGMYILRIINEEGIRTSKLLIR